MDSNRFPKVFVVVAFALLAALYIPSPSLAQAPSKPNLGHGEITANDVYVRSGASANHYPVCKLNAGERVQVVGERGDWYEIKPPPGVFSFVSGDFVDTTDDKTGVINGNRVNVRAGSSLKEYASLKYAVQTQLSRGAPVTIIERLPDSFLKINPPDGVTVWVSRQFIELVPSELVRLEQQAQSTATPNSTAGGPPVLGTPSGLAVPKSVASNSNNIPTFHGLPLTEHRTLLEEIDGDARTELEKPVVERSYAMLIDRYQTVAGQEEDSFAQRYARTRIQQLTNMSKLAEKVRTLRALGDEVDQKRRRFLEERAKIGATLPPIPAGLEIQGELRVSALYPRTQSPERYRLVEWKGELERTIAYVEIPADVSIDADTFLGRYVGVRASARRLQSGGVDPVPIYIARQLVLLQPTTTP